MKLHQGGVGFPARIGKDRNVWMKLSGCSMAKARLDRLMYA